MSDNWVVQNLENALNTWNEKLAEIWQLVTQSPEQFKGGTIWSVIVNIHGALQAIGLALLVLFFVVGVMRTCGSFAEVKKPEHALKLFIRFALAKGVVTYGLELMMALFNIVQGVISTIMNTVGFGTADEEDNIISITDFSRGDTVMVVLKDSFDEELIFYYPTVYQVRLISSEK